MMEHLLKLLRLMIIVQHPLQNVANIMKILASQLPKYSVTLTVFTFHHVIYAGYNGALLLDIVLMSSLNGSNGGHVGLVLLPFEQMRMVPTSSIIMSIDFLDIYFLLQSQRITTHKSMMKTLDKE